MVRLVNVLRKADSKSVCSFVHENPRELNLRYAKGIRKLQNRPRDISLVLKELRMSRGSFLIVIYLSWEQLGQKEAN